MSAYSPYLRCLWLKHRRLYSVLFCVCVRRNWLRPHLSAFDRYRRFLLRQASSAGDRPGGVRLGHRYVHLRAAVRFPARHVRVAGRQLDHLRHHPTRRLPGGSLPAARDSGEPCAAPPRVTSAGVVAAARSHHPEDPGGEASPADHLDRIDGRNADHARQPLREGRRGGVQGRVATQAAGVD